MLPVPVEADTGLHPSSPWGVRGKDPPTSIPRPTPPCRGGKAENQGSDLRE